MRPLHSSEFFSQPRRFSHAIPGLQTLRIFNLTEGLRPQTQTPAPSKPKSSDREQSRHSTHLPSRNTRPSKSRQTLACYSQSELLPSVTTHRLRLIAGHSIVVPAHQSPHQLICRHSVVVPARQSPHPTHLQSCAHQSSSVSQQASSFRATQLSPKAFLQSPTKACRAQHLLSQTQTSTSSKPKSSDPNQSRADPTTVRATALLTRTSLLCQSPTPRCSAPSFGHNSQSRPAARVIAGHSLVVLAHQSPHPTHLQSCSHQSSSVSQQASSFRATHPVPSEPDRLQSPTPPLSNSDLNIKQAKAVRPEPVATINSSPRNQPSSHRCKPQRCSPEQASLLCQSPTPRCFSSQPRLRGRRVVRLRLIAGHSVVVPARQSPHPTHLQSFCHQSSSVSQQASSSEPLTPFRQSPTKACRAQHLLSQTQTSTSSKPSRQTRTSRDNQLISHLAEISRAHTSASHSATHQNKQASSVRAQHHSLVVPAHHSSHSNSSSISHKASDLGTPMPWGVWA